MGREVLTALLNNAALLITLVVVYSAFYTKSIPSRLVSRQIISGLLLGLVTLAVMMNSWQLSPGVVFDTRTVVLGLVGLFFGFLPSAIAASMAVVLRLAMGGEGALPGIGTILSSVSVGLLWRFVGKRKVGNHSLLELYLFGVVVHSFMLICMLFLPEQSRDTFFSMTALPVMIIYPLATMAIGWAITDQIARQRGKAAERELVVMSERLATIVKTAPIAIVSIDLDYNVMGWNEGAEKIFGWKESEVIGKPLPYIHEKHRAEHRKMNEETFKGRPVRGARFVRHTKEGKEVVVKVYNSPIHDEKGNLAGLFGILEDVTAQHKMELALNESELLFRQLYVNMNVGVAIYRVVNDGDDIVFLDMNPAGCRITGVKREEILGRSVRAIFPGVVELGLYNRILDVWSSGYSQHHPVKEYHDGRLTFWAENFIYRHKTDEIVVVFEDVTQREMTLEVLESRVKKRTEELEEVNRELEAFAYSVSHDLKAPLRAIRGFSKIISDRYASLLPEEGSRYLGFIVKAGEDMSELITGLLEYSRVGRSALNLQVLSLQDIVSDCVSMLAGMIEEKRAEVTVLSDLPNVYADNSLLRRALTNLLQNSLTYHKSGECPVIKVYSDEHDGFVNLTVEDNGIGIENKFHERIFNIFQRLHTGDEYPGTGIGLAIVKKSIALMGGEVSLESEPSKGARFTIRIKGAKT
ncbi:MAG: PAS domain S-box protein [Kosmotogaceae bacterium]|nr:PAS domain S-box protein [Kosmotogaceae bacterium]